MKSEKQRLLIAAVYYGSYHQDVIVIYSLNKHLLIVLGIILSAVDMRIKGKRRRTMKRRKRERGREEARPVTQRPG